MDLRSAIRHTWTHHRMGLRWWPWVVAVLLALATVFATARVLVDAQLAANGDEEAENWVAFVQTGVPELGASLKGAGFSTQALQQLRLLSTADEVYRFQLFDMQARLLIDSDTLAGDGAAAPAPEERVLSAVREVAATGEEQLEVIHDADEQHRHVSVVIVPVAYGGQRMGVFRVFIDQSERAEDLEASFLLLFALVLVLTCALAGTAAWRAWGQLREKLQTEDRVRYLASHDVLSGTLNRNSFSEVLEAAAWRQQGGGPGFAVLCIDLDRFKEVNDGHGHAAGDEVLRLVGERLRSVLRHGDAVARLGGDEFAVMQSGVQSPNDASKLADRVISLLSLPFEVAGVQLSCGASVGAALYVRGLTPAELLKQADAALYQAKAGGRGRHRFYDAEVESFTADRRELARDLRLALEAGQMTLAFQALYGKDGAQLRGYEALMRWTHPVRGAVSPGQFIPLAEEGQLIDALGAWALREACRQAARWPDELTIAVNLSPAQFERGDLVASVRQALAESGLEPRRLELEITESLLINNTQQVLATLKQLSAMGVRIAMDDFGTGYSSLAYLWRFPFDRIKIDRAFVKDIADDPKVELIVKSIIDLAHALRIRVTGEGVETKRQLQTLQRHGCDEMQGFLLARPASAEQLPHAQAEAPQAVGATAQPSTAAGG
jgi:diguanylate cyclase (GGDEF)-like protein